MNIREYPMWMIWSRMTTNQPWMVHHWTAKRTRSDSIAAYSGGQRRYVRDRKRGLLKCVRVYIVPEDPSALPGRTAEGEET